LVNHQEQTPSEREPAQAIASWNIDWVAQRLPAAIYRCVVGPELTMMALTPRFEVLTGHPVRALIGNAQYSYASLIHPEDRPAVVETVRRVGETGVALEFEYRIRHANGGELWVRHEAWPVATGDGGGRACIEGFIFDVSEQCRMQRAETERHLAHVRQQRYLVELATHPALVEGRFEELAQLLTERVAELVQVERTSVWLLDAGAEQLQLVDLFKRSTATHEHHSRLSASQYPCYFAALRSGRSIDAHDAHSDPRTCEFAEDYLRPLGIVAMLDSAIRVAGKVVGVVCLEHVGATRRWHKYDVDYAGEVADQLSLALANRARLEAQAEQEELRAQLYQSQKMDALGRLAGGVAHDFNNVLMAIGGNAELLAATLEDPQLRQSAVEIVEVSYRASELIAQLLRFARREPLELRTIDLRVVVQRLEGLLRRLLDKRLHFEVRMSAEPLFVRATEVLIQQILTNLVVNARDAIAESGHIVIDVDIVDGHARLRVLDDGAGMSPEVRSKAFEPFFTTKPPGDGTGLGLATVYSIVRCCGGVVDVESELGRGTTVTVLLPLVQGTESAQ
jgi:PAS domain S-box-containing protein